MAPNQGNINALAVNTRPGVPTKTSPVSYQNTMNQMQDSSHYKQNSKFIQRQKQLLSRSNNAMSEAQHDLSDGVSMIVDEQKTLP